LLTGLQIVVVKISAYLRPSIGSRTDGYAIFSYRRAETGGASKQAFIFRNGVRAHLSVSIRLLIAAKLVALPVAGATVVAEPADLTVLDRNLFAVRPASIGSVRVVLSLPGGREVYRDAGFDF
jgi:hypothetical protein